MYTLTLSDGTTQISIHDEELVAPATFPTTEIKYSNLRPVAAVDTVLNIFTIEGDFSHRFIDGFEFSVIGSAGNNDDYVCAGDSVFNGTSTLIPVTTTIASGSIPLGNIQYTASEDAVIPLALFGKKLSQYGRAINQNFVHLTENFAHEAPPTPATKGQLFYNTTTSTYQSYNGSIWSNALIPTTLSQFLRGSYTINRPIAHFVAPYDGVIPVNAAGSFFKATANATGARTFTIFKNTTQIGTILFSAGSSTGVVTLAAATLVNASDSIIIYAPSAVDATLIDISSTLVINGRSLV